VGVVAESAAERARERGWVAAVLGLALEDLLGFPAAAWRLATGEGEKELAAVSVSVWRPALGGA
jgi:hypothetical protein